LSMITFVGDGYLKLKNTSEEEKKRFFEITIKLPFELQMLLSLRAYRLNKIFLKNLILLESLKQLACSYICLEL